MFFESTRGKYYYEIIGTGTPAFLLLHNAGGNHQFFTHQMSWLKTQGAVLAVDLLGHGQSDKPTVEYSVGDYAIDIAALCAGLNISRCICIGLNYGGNIAIELAAQSLLPLDKLILIDPPLFMSEAVIKLVSNHITHLQDPNIQHYAEELVAQSFIQTTDENKAIAAAAFNMVSRQALASVYRHLLKWDQASFAKVKNLTTPALCLLTDASLCSAHQLKACQPSIKLGQVVGSMYWATLEVPQQVNAMIARFLEVY